VGRASPRRIAAGFIERAIDRQISISRFVAASIPETSSVILNGVPRNSRPAAPEQLVLVAQRFEEEKATQVALHAWAESGLRHEGWRLALAGRGSQEAELRALVDRLGLLNSVEFIGVQSDVQSLLGRAAILLAPAPNEPFGLSVVEAMAAGVPVVAARGGGHAETVGAATDRWLFPAGASRTAARMLDALGADSAERERYGALLQSWQRTHLSVETHVDALETVYAGLAR